MENKTKKYSAKSWLDFDNTQKLLNKIFKGVTTFEYRLAVDAIGRNHSI